MEQTVQNKNNYSKAVWLQRAANGLSYARMAAAPLLFMRIARGQHRTIATTAAIGLLALSDGLDGRLARRAASLDIRVASDRGAWLDQMADKAFTHAIMSGLLVNGICTKQYGTGAAFLANQTVQAVRDAWVTSVRKEAAQHNVSTSARSLGKVKTSVLLGASAILASPLAKYPAGETIGTMGVYAGSALSVVSGISLVNSLREGIEVARQTEEEARVVEPPHAVHVEY